MSMWMRFWTLLSVWRAQNFRLVVKGWPQPEKRTEVEKKYKSTLELAPSRSSVEKTVFKLRKTDTKGPKTVMGWRFWQRLRTGWVVQKGAWNRCCCSSLDCSKMPVENATVQSLFMLCERKKITGLKLIIWSKSWLIITPKPWECYQLFKLRDTFLAVNE